MDRWNANLLLCQACGAYTSCANSGISAEMGLVASSSCRGTGGIVVSSCGGTCCASNSGSSLILMLVMFTGNV